MTGVRVEWSVMGRGRGEGAGGRGQGTGCRGQGAGIITEHELSPAASCMIYVLKLMMRCEPLYHNGYYPQTTAAEVKRRPLMIALGWGTKVVE